MKKGRRNEIYNVSAGNEMENIDIVRKILDIMNKPEEMVEFIQDRPGHDIRYSLDSSKLRKLGWKPGISLDSGLRRTVSWYLDNKNWWNRLKRFI